MKHSVQTVCRVTLALSVLGACALLVPPSSTLGETVSQGEPVPSVIRSDQPCTPVWSMYNPNSSEHLFTTNKKERTALARLGWKDEGICFGSAQDQSVPVYRFYNKTAGEHLYTASQAERESLKKAGWKEEEITFYAASKGGTPVYRLLNPNTTQGSHHYTSDQEEIKALKKLGWKEEGGAFSVYEPYQFVEEIRDGALVILAYDSFGVPVEGVIRLRTGTYYFDPQLGGAMARGWRSVPLSSLELSEETVEMAQKTVGFQAPEGKSAPFDPETAPSRSDELAESPTILIEEAPEDEKGQEEDQIEDLQAAIQRAGEKARQDREAQQSLRSSGSSSSSPASNSALSETQMVSESGVSVEEGLLLFEVEPSSGQEAIEEPDPKKESAPAVPSGQIEVYFKEDGRMAKGELEMEDGVHYFHPQTGQHYRSSWIRYGKPRKTCYFDENGIQATGKKTIGSRTFRFDQKTGAFQYDLQNLLDRCVQYIQAHQLPGEDYSLGFRIVDSNQSVFWNTHAQQSASVMKLFVMGAVFDDYEGYCERYGKANIDASLNAMITVSSNEAWVYLVTVIGDGDYAKGCERINAWNDEHGYTDTRKYPYAYGNLTSVRDCSKILADIHNRTLPGSAVMKKLIAQQAVPGRLLAGLPAGLSTGNKPGWLDDTQNDTVIVWDDQGTWTISLLSTELKDSNNAQAIMKTVAQSAARWMEENLFRVPEIR